MCVYRCVCGVCGMGLRNVCVCRCICGVYGMRCVCVCIDVCGICGMDVRCVHTDICIDVCGVCGMDMRCMCVVWEWICVYCVWMCVCFQSPEGSIVADDSVDILSQVSDIVRLKLLLEIKAANKVNCALKGAFI